MKKILLFACLTASISAFASPDAQSNEPRAIEPRKPITAAEFFDQLDTNKDGNISRIEWLESIPMPQPHRPSYRDSMPECQLGKIPPRVKPGTAQAPQTLQN